ncbi:MAG: TonB-dependent receptor [Pseudomonadales bacterium]
MKLRNVPTTVTASAMGLCVGQLASIPVVAQENALVLEEVVVTAQKREQTLEDIPGSVSAVSADYLDKTNTSSLADVGKITSGIRLESTRDGNSPVLKVRGIGTQRFNAAVSPSVGVFVDEVAKPRIDTAFTNLNDVARIEVLKGPQATLYGKQVSAGLISIVTQKPLLEEFEGKVQAKIGNSDLQEYRGSVNIPLGERFAARVNGYYTQSAFEQVENILNGDSEETVTEGGRARLLFLPTDQLEMILSLEHHQSRTEHVAQERLTYGPNSLDFLRADAAADGVPVDATGLPQDLLPADPFDGEVQSTAQSSREARNNAAMLHINWDVNDNWTINSISSYEEYTRSPTGDEPAGDGASSRLTGSGVTTGPMLPGALFFTNAVSDRNYSQEIRATYEGDKLSSIVGVFYSEASQDTRTDIARRIFGFFNNPILSSLEKNTEDIAIFTHNTWRMTDLMELTLGVRYAETEKDDQVGTIVGGGIFAAMPVTTEIPQQNDSWEAFSGTLKMIYHISEDVSAYGGYDRGFKAGGFNNPVFQGSFNAVNDFDSEVADNYEVGIKGRFFEQRVRWSLAGFFQTYKDFQLPIPDPATGIGLITENAGEVVSQGIETEFMWLVSDHWIVDGNMAYIDSFYEEYENASCFDGQVSGCSAAGTQDLSDKRVDNHSPWTATLNATYEADLGDTGMNWYARAEAAFRDDVIGLSNHDPVARQHSYTLYNASLGLDAADESWKVVLWGKNLADEEYISTYLLASDEGVPGNIRSILGRVGDERSYGVDLIYRF